MNSEPVEKYKNLEFAFPEGTLRGATILVPGGTGGLGAALVARLLIEQAIPSVGYLSNKERARRVGLKDRVIGMIPFGCRLLAISFVTLSM